MSDFTNPSIISHVSVGTSDVKRACAFYDAVLATIGARRVLDEGFAVAYGKQFPEFWVQPPHNGAPPQSATAHILPSLPVRAPKSMRFTLPRLRQAARTTVPLAHAPTTAPNITALSSATSMATRSRRCSGTARRRNSAQAGNGRRDRLGTLS